LINRDGDHEAEGAKHTVRQVCQGLGEKEENKRDDRRRRKLG
jgi:hypothetical protein